jgi:DNA-binding CsgD family transcriptional regulator
MSLKEKIKALASIADNIPGIIIVHDVENLTVEFMSEKGLRILGITMEDLKAMGEEYNRKYFNPEDTEDYIPKVIGLMERGDENEEVTFFQQVRPSEEAPWEWHLSTTKIFMKNEEGKTSHIITIACPVDPLHHITSKVNRLLEENMFLRKNQNLFSQLTNREKSILRLMALGLSSQEIADKLYIAETTVKTHRKNIRSKIKAQSNFDITKFAQAFDLI